jgi:hypothetical protein
MNDKLKTMILEVWEEWHSDLFTDPKDAPMLSPSFEKGASVIYEALIPLLKKSFPVMRAHAEASHMLEGFNEKKNHWDDLVDEIRSVIKD